MMLHHWWHPEHWQSLLVIVALLAISIIASLIAGQPRAADDRGRPDVRRPTWAPGEVSANESYRQGYAFLDSERPSAVQ